MAVWNVIFASQIDVKSRIDSDYFLPEYLESERKLDKIATKKITELFSVSDGNHLEVSRHFSDNKEMIPYYRGKDINDFFIENANPVRIPKQIYNSGMMKRSHFIAGDVLLSIVGTIGSLSIVSETLGDATGSCKIAILRKRGEYSPFLLAAFLLSKHGQSQIKRNTRGAVQMGLILKDFVNIRVPFFDSEVMMEIESLIIEAIRKNSLSKSLYLQAQEILKNELGLDKLEIKKYNTYESSFSEIISSNRMDTEYFNPNVKEIYKLQCFSEAKPLNEVFNIIRGKTPTTYYDAGIPVLKTKNIRTPVIDKSKINDYANVTDKNPKTILNDLILASMGVGSLGRISYVFENNSNSVIDGTLRILRAKENFELYAIPTLLFLTSDCGQLLIYQGIIGSTGIISLPDYHLKNIRLPLLNTDISLKLTNMVIDSYKEKEQSEFYLEEAIRRVERLVEGVN